MKKYVVWVHGETETPGELGVDVGVAIVFAEDEAEALISAVWYFVKSLDMFVTLYGEVPVGFSETGGEVAAMMKRGMRRPTLVIA